MPTPSGRLTAAEIAKLAALIEAQQAVREQLTQIAVAAATAAFRSIRNWWDTDEVVVTALETLRVVQAAQLRMAQVTDAYLARALSIQLGRTVRPVGAVDVTRLRRKVDEAVADRLSTRLRILEPEGRLDIDRFFDQDEPDPQPQPDRGEDALVEATEEDQLRLVQPENPVNVYSRVAAQYRFEVTEGIAETQAAEDALARAATIAETDITLAHRAQANRVLRQQDPGRVIGYRRILKGKRQTGGPVCGLCIVAADRIYHREDLQPIHANCRCDVLPVTTFNDPGLNLTAAQLDELYRAASARPGGQSTAGRQLKKVRVAVGEHGELGPILVEAPKTSRPSPGRRGARDVVASRRPAMDPAQRLARVEASLERMRRQLEAGDERMRLAIQYQESLVEKLRAEVAAAS
jgi:hypothetical protein